MSISAERVKSPCELCGQIDTHPKHHPNERSHHHLDCGRSQGCLTCDAVLRASGDLHGEALTRFMESRVAVPSGV